MQPLIRLPILRSSAGWSRLHGAAADQSVVFAVDDAERMGVEAERPVALLGLARGDRFAGQTFEYEKSPTHLGNQP